MSTSERHFIDINGDGKPAFVVQVNNGDVIISRELALQIMAILSGAYIHCEEAEEVGLRLEAAMASK